jgi:hypothetical protein
MDGPKPAGAVTVYRGSVTGAPATFLERKASLEVEGQLQQLQAECAAKDEEIGRLRELSSQGKMQVVAVVYIAAFNY